MVKSNEARIPQSPKDSASDRPTNSGEAKDNRARVLFLDDDPNIRRSCGEDLEKAGFYVDRVETTQQARQYLTHEPEYDVAFVDIMLKDDIPGDKFILDNLELFGDARVVAITAENNHIDPDRIIILDNAGVETIFKIFGLSKTLISVVKEEVEKRNQQAQQPQQPTPEKTAFMSMLEQLLLDWLRSRSQPDKQRVYIGGHLYSYNQIADEIVKGSEIGNAHLKMMATVFMSQMNLK